METITSIVPTCFTGGDPKNIKTLTFISKKNYRPKFFIVSMSRSTYFYPCILVFVQPRAFGPEIG